MVDDNTISWEQDEEIIHKICKQFKIGEQILQFKQVCKKREKNLIYRKHPPISFLTSLVLPIPSFPRLPFYHSTTKLILEANSICLINNNNPSHSLQMPWMIMARGSDTAVGSIQLQHPLTGARVETMTIPPSLDLRQFRPHELAQGYDFKYSAKSEVRKVIVLCSSSSTCLEVLVFYKEGILGKLTVRVPESQDDDEEVVEEEVRYRWKKLDSRNVKFDYLDDVIEYKEMYYGIDRKGRLYELNIETMKVKYVVVSEPIVGHEREVPGHRRKRLVVDTTSEEHELHLVVREYVKDRGNEVRIKIYRFHSQDEKWEEMQHLGRDKVLFVGVKHCFYVETKDRGIPGFNKENCLVFAANCFPLYRKSTDAHDKKLFGYENSIKLGSYRIGRKNSFSFLSSQFSSLIWPPPTWFPLTGEWNDNDDQETNSGSSGEQASDERTSPDPSNETVNSEEDDLCTPLPLQYEKPMETCKTRNQKKRKRLDTVSPSSEERVHAPNANSTPAAPSTGQQSPTSCHSTLKFEGVEIKSELVPILETIKNEHGLFDEGSQSIVRSKNMRTCALELVAKLKITILNTNGWNLTDSLVEDLQSNLADLRCLGLKVDWLAPAVEKATKLHKRYKSEIEKMLKLKKSIADIDEKKKQLEKELDSLNARIPSSELDDFLGVGL